MTNKTAIPRTRRTMAIYAVVAASITTAITATTIRQQAEQVRVERIRADMRSIERAERQIAIR